MENTTDRLTIYLENGQIVNVVCDDPSRASELTTADCEAITKNGYRVMASSIECRRYPDGNCYYVIGGRKYRCNCPDGNG